MSNEKHLSIQRKALELTSAAAYAGAHQLKEKNAGAFLADNRSNAPVQMKSYVKNVGQQYKYAKKKSQMVGLKMQAWLDPTQPLRGQSANLNTSQDEMMGQIRADYGIKGGNVVKGHLLNDNLGGSALSTNLYPITKAANSAHLGYVENVAKDIQWSEEEGIYYRVDVDGTPDISQAAAAFDCEIHEWNPKKDKIGKQLLGVKVNSNLDDVSSKGAYHDVEDIDMGEEPEREKNPKKPKGFVNPATREGDLEQWEKNLRNKDNAKTLGDTVTYNF